MQNMMDEKWKKSFFMNSFSDIGISKFVAAPVTAWILPAATASPPRLHEIVAAFGGLI